ncbi:Armadillo repeat protein deleted in velo-cardio-facial syndrome [Merluccius polli]|uniref:Armadillo repeat protein deleted in velo-cardio-facial syndrome n=1 Tax=Merluccius polli TaxID=89951 RepID=A0AA47MVX1_MERPO|nr:Armadillo repeat protein deleted in velo-cardio-facial syndrome [Merluccius polli]
MPAEVKEEQSSEGPPRLTLLEAKDLDHPTANEELDTPTSNTSMVTVTNDSSAENDTPQQTDSEDPNVVEPEGDSAETPESSAPLLSPATPDDDGGTLTPLGADAPPDPPGRVPHAQFALPPPGLAAAAAATTLPWPGETQLATADAKNGGGGGGVFHLPSTNDGFKGLGGELSAGVYGSLTRGSLHGYWPARNFQAGAHFTLPFPRDMGPRGQPEAEGPGEPRAEDNREVRADRPPAAAAGYQTLGGNYPFRPITTMELLREPSRTRGGYEDGIMPQLDANQNPPPCRRRRRRPSPSLLPHHTLHLPHNKRSSMVSLDGVRRDPCWRDPNLREVISMLGHPMDPVKSNAAAYLQHLCYENDRIKQEVRQLRGVPLLVELLDHPRAEVHQKACGALRNISYGKDHNNKVAIKICDGIPALVRLLRKSSGMEVRELVTGTLWNLSSHEPLKMAVINHGLQTLTDEVIIPHSGWRRDPGGASGPVDTQWTTVFRNTSGCLRNVSSDGAEARQRLRECEGLVDALLHALHSAVVNGETDNKSVENCVCILRNLSYHVHKEVPGAERFQEPHVNLLSRPGGQQQPQQKKKQEADSLGGKRAKGLELLYQPEVVRLYLSLLTCSQNHNTLEAAAGALQNLSAGHWAWSNYIRATVRKEKGLPILVDLLRADADKVLRAVSIALRNLAIDRRNKDIIGNYAIRDLVGNLPCGQQHPAKNLESDTVVSILNTIHEIITDNQDNARALIQGQAIHKLVAINRTSQSSRETKAAAHVLQTIWSYKDLRNNLYKAGWKKSLFKPVTSGVSKKSKGGKQGNDEITLPLMEKNTGLVDSKPPPLDSWV